MGDRRRAGRRRRRRGTGLRSRRRPALRHLRHSHAVHDRPGHLPPVRLVLADVADLPAVLHQRVPHAAARDRQRAASSRGRSRAGDVDDVFQRERPGISEPVRRWARGREGAVRDAVRAVGGAFPAARDQNQHVLRRPRPAARIADVHVHDVPARIADQRVGRGEGE